MMKLGMKGAIALAILTAGCGGADEAATPADPKAGSAASTPDVEGARRLVDAIYTPYTRGEPNSATQHFTPELNAAVEGAEGLGADPFCDCQDFDRFSYTIQSVEPAGEGAAARVAISNFGESKVIPIQLVQRDGAWKVADVGEGENSLARQLAQPTQ